MQERCQNQEASRLRIIVVNYNRADITLRCVESINSQTYQPRDIVVVDNYSSDSEVYRLRKILAKDILLLENATNLGYAEGNNVGARCQSLPEAGYIMFLNNDVALPDPSTCKKLVSVLENNRHIIAASPLVHDQNAQLPPESSIQVRRVPDFWTNLVSGSWWLRRLPGTRQLYNRYVYADQRPYLKNSINECETINGSCFVIDASFLREIGYLDSNTFLYYEEIILGWQTKDRSKTACLVASTVVNHEQGATTGHGRERFRLDMKMEMVRSELHYCRRYLRASKSAISLLLLVRAIDLSSLALYSGLKKFLP